MSKQLETTFTKYGDTFTQLERSGKYAIFFREDVKTGKCSGYEVICVQTASNPQIMGGKIIRNIGDEFYPSASQFGSQAWMFVDNKKAYQKFTELAGNPKRKIIVVKKKGAI